MRLAIETLLEVVESEKNIELCIIKAGNVTEMVPESRIQTVVNEINAEREAQEESKRARWKSSRTTQYWGSSHQWIPSMQRGSITISIGFVLQEQQNSYHNTHICFLQNTF